MSTIKKFFADESGATAIEYGLIVTVLSLAIVSGISNVYNAIDYLFSDTNSELNTAFN